MNKAVIYIFAITLLSCTSTTTAVPNMTKAEALERARTAELNQGEPDNSFRIAILGDSISAGVNSDYDGRVSFGWVDRFKELLRGLWSDAHVGNFAWPGALAYQWTFDKKLQPLVDYKPQVVVVFIGGNDGLAYARDGVFTESEYAEMKGLFESILNQLKSKLPNAKIVLTSYYDLFDGLSAQAGPWLTSMKEISPLMLKSRDLLMKESLERGVGVVDLYPIFMHRAYGREIGDTKALEPMYLRPYNKGMDIHPNTLGHEAIAKEFYTYFKNNAQNIRP